MVMNRQASVQDAVTYLQNRGKEALDVAVAVIQNENIRYKPLHDALGYFVDQVFPDIMQPGFLSLYCEAGGGKPSDTVQVGAAIVLFVGAADLHDDVLDSSLIKNHKPTVLGKFGKEIAVLAGDAFLIMGTYLLHRAIAGCTHEKADAILKQVKQAFFDLSSAEAEEASHRRKNDLSSDQYLRIIKKKVAVSEATARIGAILAGSTEEEVEVLGELGRVLGLLNTLRDEFIDVFEPEELANRFKNEILPLPILQVFQDPQKKAKILGLLKKGNVSKKKTEKIADLVFKAKETEELREIMLSKVSATTRKLSHLKGEREILKLLLDLSLDEIL
jgi:geranylgeranyl pyrophosphate synthase